MTAIETFDWTMQNVPGTQSVISLPGLAKIVNAGFNEGNIKWRQLPRDPQVMAQSVTPIDTATGLLNPDCSAMQVLVNTTDQQGETIARLVAAVKSFTSPVGAGICMPCRRRNSQAVRSAASAVEGKPIRTEVSIYAPIIGLRPNSPLIS